jgi:hypothetical protein
LMVREVEVPEVVELEVRIPTFQVAVTLPVGKFEQFSVEGKVALIVVVALTLFLLRISLFVLVITRETVLLAN